MNDLEQRLRDAFAGRAATTQIDRRSDPPPAHGGATAVQRSWPLIVGVAAAVVVITVLGLAMLVRSPADDMPASDPSTPSPTSPSASVDLLPEVFPALPADDPRNAEAVAAYSGFVSFETTDAGRALVGQIDDEGRLVDPVTITVFADIDAIPLESPYDDGGEEVVVDGVTYTRYVLGSNPVRIALVDRGDTDVAVVGEDPAAFISAAGGIPLADIVVRSDGGVSFSLGDLPDGYQTIVPPSTFPIMSPRVDLTIGTDGDETFGYLTTGRLSDLLLHAGSTPFRQVDIDGTTGWAEDPSGGGVGLIVWQVAPDTWATVMGSDESALELARDAVFVDEATWQATYDVTRPDDPRFAGATPVEPGTTPSVPTAPSSTAPPTEPVATTGPVGGTANAELVGRSWVRVPTDDEFHYQYELELSFPDATTVTGYDGCDAWDADVTINPLSNDDSELGQVYDVAVDLGFIACASEQQLMVNRQITVGSDRLQLHSGAGAAVYIDTDTLDVPQADELVGAWTTRSGSRLELLAGGSARLGACAPAGTWTYQDGQLQLAGFDTSPAETAACSNGGLSGIVGGLTPELTESTVTADITTNETDLLVRLGERALWLQPAGPISPLDLESSTAYGFGPVTDISAEFIIDTVTAVAGPPTFDTGWNTIAPTDNGDTADCYGGLGQRIVFWNDIRFGFLRGDFPPDGDRLYMVGAGSIDRAGLFGYDGPLPDLAGMATVASQGVGPGNTIDEFAAAGYPISEQQILGGGVRQGFVSVTGDIITGVEYTNPGFC
ncbi:hypothetical protein BDK89_0340 [Ilumatobacter fluminis]|uniref:Uncharacterized protein n=1 Tax=Ilumatobacter fluminis TaxID=467091 RepID=A0A4R7HW73_9ACTN|nr:hypothetical protein [Ilumatobacter fluminis]TDT14784.1 hypothetical protein BDK89_0340 [Ilumatobacter fluminis]